MTSPLIAVTTYHLEPGRVAMWDTGGHGVPDSYVSALRRAGARAALIPGPDGDATDLLRRVDGLLLTGGGDVEPSRYGATAHPEVYGVNEQRDEFEVALVLAANRELLPTLAICRGIQVVNVAFGGSLHQHLPDIDSHDLHGLPKAGGGRLHEVNVSESSRLSAACGSPVISCSSSHHQGLDRLGDGLVPVGWSGDGLVEAIEREEGWLIGVQWHPEATATNDTAQQALFDGLVREASRRAG